MSDHSGIVDIVSAVSAAVAAGAAAWAVRESAGQRQSDESSRRLRETVDEFKEHVTKPVLAAIEDYAHEGVKSLVMCLPQLRDSVTGNEARRSMFESVHGALFVLRWRVDAYARSLGAGHVARRIDDIFNAHEDQLLEALEEMSNLSDLRRCQAEYWGVFKKVMTLVLVEENAIVKRFEKRRAKSIA